MRLTLAFTLANAGCGREPRSALRPAHAATGSIGVLPNFCAVVRVGADDIGLPTFSSSVDWVGDVEPEGLGWVEAAGDYSMAWCAAQRILRREGDDVVHRRELLEQLACRRQVLDGRNPVLAAELAAFMTGH